MTYISTFKRAEIKYLLSDEQYRAFRQALEDKDIARVDAYGETTILNIYYDTQGSSLIRASLEGPAYKEKFRLRSYGVPKGDTTTFLEIKKKYDGIVYKRRVDMPYDRAIEHMQKGASSDAGSRCSSEQILSEIDYFRKVHSGLRPAMVIAYDRIAMAGVADPELRITFDRNIRWRTDRLDLREGADGRQLLAPGQHLMELKIAGAIPLDIAALMDSFGIYKTSFSKYGKAFTVMRSEQVERQRMVAAYRTTPENYRTPKVRGEIAVA